MAERELKPWEVDRPPWPAMSVSSAAKALGVKGNFARGVITRKVPFVQVPGKAEGVSRTLFQAAAVLNLAVEIGSMAPEEANAQLLSRIDKFASLYAGVPNPRNVCPSCEVELTGRRALAHHLWNEHPETRPQVIEMFPWVVNIPPGHGFDA